MKNLKILSVLVLIATLSRVAIPPLFGHPVNFSALDATALCCGTFFQRRMMALCAILLIVTVSDLFFTPFYPGWQWQYLSYLLITLIGFSLNVSLRGSAFYDRSNPGSLKAGLLRPKSGLAMTPTLNIISASLISSLLFFLISNFGVWQSGMLYPNTFEGLMTCYAAAIPFLKNTIVSDLFFIIVILFVARMAGESRTSGNNFIYLPDNSSSHNNRRWR